MSKRALALSTWRRLGPLNSSLCLPSPACSVWEATHEPYHELDAFMNDLENDDIQQFTRDCESLFQGERQAGPKNVQAPALLPRLKIESFDDYAAARSPMSSCSDGFEVPDVYFGSAHPSPAMMRNNNPYGIVPNVAMTTPVSSLRTPFKVESECLVSLLPPPPCRNEPHPLSGDLARLRAACLRRYREKKARRSHTTVVRYQLRKDNADKRPRYKGRFMKKEAQIDGANSS